MDARQVGKVLGLELLGGDAQLVRELADRGSADTCELDVFCCVCEVAVGEQWHGHKGAKEVEGVIVRCAGTTPCACASHEI